MSTILTPIADAMFILNPAGRIERINDDGDVIGMWQDPELYPHLVAAGYPHGPYLLGIPEQEHVIDVSFDSTSRTPEVTAYLTSRDPAQRQRTMGEASAVFLQWFREHVG